MGDMSITDIQSVQTERFQMGVLDLSSGDRSKRDLLNNV